MRLIVGSRNLATAGTALLASSAAVTLKVRSITAHARSTNAGTVYFGGSDVTATFGHELTANQSISFTFGEDGEMSLGDFYFNASTTAQTIDISAIVSN